jgi:hypothetical protein
MEMNHRDHQAAIQAKRLREELEDEEAARIADLLAADQQQQQEQPAYREEKES